MQTVAVVLHYENEEMTNQCVDSITKTAPEVCILIVDNNSPKPYEKSWDRSKCADLVVVRNNDRNAVSGMNYGFLMAIQTWNPKYIVNFDSDIICLAGWHKPLVDVMESDPKIGIVGGKQWTGDMAFHREVGLDLIGGHLAKDWPDDKREVMWIQGSAVMMRVEMMKKIGVHDDRFKIICSDSDYCLHAKDRGWKVVFTPESSVIHLGGASYTKTVDTWQEDNRALMQKWSSISGMKLLNGFPLDSNKNRHLQASFKMVEVPHAVQEQETGEVDVRK